MFLSKTAGSGHKTLTVASVKPTAQALGSWRGSPNLGLSGPGLSMCQFQVHRESCTLYESPGSLRMPAKIAVMCSALGLSSPTMPITTDNRRH